MPPIEPIPPGPPPCIMDIAAAMFCGVMISRIMSGLVRIALICGFYAHIWLSIGFWEIIWFMNSGLESIC
jgi:hypothetical protein